jgi:hypothetical protein
MFEKIVQDIYEVFASSVWVNTGIKAVPRSFQGTLTENKYVLISIIPGKTKPSSTQHQKCISGLLIVSIYVPTTKGDVELFNVANTLDGIFQRKVLTQGTMMDLGSLKPIGIDKDNSALYTGDYYISFNLYGE